MYDQKCYELAEHFFPEAAPVKLEELAQLLQDTVEDFDPELTEEEEEEDETLDEDEPKHP
jgi:hypothetical protein